MPGHALGRGDLELGDPEARALSVPGAPLHRVQMARVRHGVHADLLVSRSWRRRVAAGAASRRSPEVSEGCAGRSGSTRWSATSVKNRRMRSRSASDGRQLPASIGEHRLGRGRPAWSAGTTGRGSSAGRSPRRTAGSGGTAPARDARSAGTGAWTGRRRGVPRRSPPRRRAPPASPAGRRWRRSGRGTRRRPPPPPTGRRPAPSRGTSSPRRTGPAMTRWAAARSLAASGVLST